MNTNEQDNLELENALQKMMSDTFKIHQQHFQKLTAVVEALREHRYLYSQHRERKRLGSQATNSQDDETDWAYEAAMAADRLTRALRDLDKFEEDLSLTLQETEARALGNMS